MGHLGVAPKISDAFRHGTPPRRAAGFVGRPKNLELARIVDGRLDTESIGVVVEFDGIRLEAETDPAAFRALFAVDRDLACKTVMWLAAKAFLTGRDLTSIAAGMTSVAPSAVTDAVTRSSLIASSAARSRNRMSVAYSHWSITHQ
jgi:hypothetical protein